MTGESSPAPNLLHAIFCGRVQGVGFRVIAKAAARRHGCTGWVRNLGDGSVEVQARADENDLVEFLTELSMGPPWSHVADIEVRWEHLDEEPEETTLRIRR